MNTVTARLRSHAHSRPNALFSTFLAGDSAQQITFEALYERSAAYARRYIELGIAPGDLVIIILKHTPHLFYSYLGAMLAGAIPSFMPFLSPKQRPNLYWADHRALFDRIEPRLLVTFEAGLDEMPPSELGVPTLIASDDVLLRSGDDASWILREPADPDAIACLQHSSGTTGLKKGVMLSHRAILREIAAYGSSIRLDQRDIIASWLPLYHDMGFIACFVTSVCEGTHLVALDPFEWTTRPQLLFEAIERYRATLCWLPNFAFSHLVNTARKTDAWDLSSMRAFINCSEPCKAQTFERFAQRFADVGVSPERLAVCYAMAENVFAATQTKLGVAPRALSTDNGVTVLSCGAPVEGVRLDIRQDGASVPDGTVGEIHVASPFLFDGYYKLPDKTRERLVDGWYATGDLGFLADGELFVTGRIDDMIVLNGRNFYAHDLEATLNTIAGVLPGKNVVLGADRPGADATVLVVLTETAADGDFDAIAHEIRTQFSQTAALAVFAVIQMSPGELVKTTSGKISRSKNKELFLAGGFKGRRA